MTQFNKELDSQINKVSYARNKVILKETWHSISGKDSVKGWCKDYKVPLLWIVPKESQGAFRTLIDVQKNNYSHNTAVVSAINTLKSMDVAFLTNQQKVEEAFLKLIGPEFQKLWNEVREEVIAEAKQQIGNDMSDWNVADLTTLQKILKKKQQEKAKKEKLAGAKSAVRSMNENKLRDRVERFLDAHPEFCDDLTA